MTLDVRAVDVIALLLAAAAFAACGDPAAPHNPGAVLGVDVDSAGGPIVRSVTIHLDQPAPVEVTYGAPATPVLTIAADSFSTEHRIILPRLWPSREYALEAAVLRGTSPSLSASFGTGALPPELAAIELHATGSPSMPVALIEVMGGTQFTGLLMVEDGGIVGYLGVNQPLLGMTRRASGDLVLVDAQLGLVVRHLDGSTAARLPQPDDAPGAAYGRMHHDVTATPSNTLLFIANDTREVAGESVVGEALWEWNPETGSVVKRWSAFDFLDWTRERGTRSVPGNWLHGNGISYGPRGNVLMSLRNVDMVISIAPDFSGLEWSLGGVTGTLAVAAEDRFHGQHYVTEPSPGRVLVFDNGFERPEGLFTRAIEYAVDAQRGTATRVWEYRHSPDIYASLVGSARRMPNGNTTVLFGMLAGHSGSSGPITAVEVTSSGKVEWRLTFGPQLTRLYRLTPVTSLLGEVPGQFRAR